MCPESLRRPAERRALRPVVALRRLTLLSLLALAGCQTGGSGGEAPATAAIADLPTGVEIGPEDLFIVDCLLPGQARRLGTRLTYVAARKAIKVPAYDCARRGGEYVLPGQDGRQAALAQWLPSATAGDAEAQTFVGEIYERGVEMQPDFAEAAVWYEKAAAQGNTRALVNLAALYETGSGVTKNRNRAAELYAEAAGLDRATFEAARADAAPARAPVVLAAAPAVDPAVEAQNRALRAELAETRGELTAAQARIDRLGERSAEAQARAVKLERERAALVAKLETSPPPTRVARAEPAAPAPVPAPVAPAEAPAAAVAPVVAAAPVTAPATAPAPSGISEAEAEALRVALAEKDAQLAAERREAEALQTQLVAVQAQAEQRVGQAEAALSAAEPAAEKDAEIEALRSALADSRRDLQDREAQVTDLIDRERAAAAELERLRADRLRLAEKLETVNDGSADNAAAVTALSAEVAVQDRKLAESANQIALLQAEIEAVRAASARELAEAQETANALIARSERDRAALEGSLATAETQVATLESELDESRSSLAAQETEIAFLRTDLKALQSRTAAQPAGPSPEQSALVAELERQIAARERELAARNAEIDALNSELEEVRDSVRVSSRGTGGAALPTAAAAEADVGQQVAQFLAETRVLFGNFHALLIGNTKHALLPDLETPARDVNRIAAILRDRYGFKVEVLLDATRYQIMTAVNKYYRTLNENDNFLLYYAGHGEIDEVNKRGHWLPVDAEPDNRANWLSVQSITDQLAGMNVRKAIVIADSCYSGILTRASITRLRPGMSETGMKQFLLTMSEKRSRMVLSSGGVRPVLDGGGAGGHSVFARAFIDALAGNSEIIEGFELYREVAQRVTEAAARLSVEQTPEYAPMRFAGHESGDFFFIPRSAI
ncbi:MAG: caspase family protein [Pseudomonadota bacterium]